MAESESNEGRLPLNSQLDELDAHLDDLLQEADPSAHFNATLFDRINYQLGPVSYPDLTARFLPRVGLVLKKTAEVEKTNASTAASSSESAAKGYPPPLITLTIKLLRPLPFTQALELCEPEYLATALSSPEEHINSLALAILEKAAHSPSDASILASAEESGLLEAFLERWLISPSVAVGQQGVLLLGDLLDVDCPLSQPLFTDEQKDLLDIRLVTRRAPGHGAVWRRLFGDEALCWQILQKIETDLLPHPSSSSSATLTPAEQNKILAQRSFAQDRLLRLLPRLAILDFPALNHSVAPLGPPDGKQPVSLLDFATLHMVDRAADPLMHLTWIDYMMKLVGALRVSDTARLSADTLRRLIRESKDLALLDALWEMPENLVWTPMGEAEAMRTWLRDVAPRPAPRIANRMSDS